MNYFNTEKEKKEKKKEEIKKEEEKKKEEIKKEEEKKKEKIKKEKETSEKYSEEQHDEEDSDSEFEEDVRKKLSECVASVNELVEDEDLSQPANAEQTKRENEKRLEEYNKKQLEETVDALEKSRDNLMEAVKNKKAYDKWDKETSDETYTALQEEVPEENSEKKSEVKKEKTYVLSFSPEKLKRKKEKIFEKEKNEEATKEKFMIILAESGECFDIDSDYYTIGKSEECSLVLPYTYISRRHALITRVDGSYYIEDLGSTNGTFVSGIKLAAGKKTRIIPGEKIKFANINVIVKTA